MARIEYLLKRQTYLTNELKSAKLSFSDAKKYENELNEINNELSSAISRYGRYLADFENDENNIRKSLIFHKHDFYLRRLQHGETIEISNLGHELSNEILNMINHPQNKINARK